MKVNTMKKIKAPAHPYATVTLTTTPAKNERLANTIKKLYNRGKIEAKSKNAFVREAVNYYLADLGEKLKV